MTSAIDVLVYIKKSFHTLGRMQRQKILYYAQAWHLAWQGTALFEEEIQAWENGPAVPEAWRADESWHNDLSVEHDGNLTLEQIKIVDAVWEFYGREGGTALSVLTLTEDPWTRHYENVHPFLCGRDIIPKDEMRAYYSMETHTSSGSPQKPVLESTKASSSDLLDAIAVESHRWDETLRILADR